MDAIRNKGRLTPAQSDAPAFTGFVCVRGAREHNLRNVSLTLPRNRLIVMTGVSGSGKSSLAFDTLYAEGETAPKMMSVGLHCRLVGRPGRAAALARFLDYVQSQDRVWICRRLDIARHWHEHHRP